MDHQAEIRILGPLEVTVGGRVLAVTGERQRRIVAALADAGEPGLGVDQLAEVIWDDADRPAQPTAHVRTAISRLRRQLTEAGGSGPDLIESRPGGYRLGGVDVDAWRFERLLVDDETSVDPDRRRRQLDQALDLWRGDAFDGFADVASLQPSVTRLGELRLAAETERLEAWLDDGDIGRTLARSAVLAHAHPWHEELRRIHVLALYRAGRQTDALRELDRHRRRVRDELGLDPAPSLQALESAILDHDVSIGRATPTGRALRGYRVHDVVAEVSNAPRSVRKRAHQPALDREVVVETTTITTAESELLPVIDHRVRLRAAIRHPHVEEVIDHWREPGAVHVVTPAWPLTLSDRLVEGPLSLPSVAQLGAGLAAALDAAHEADLIHGDLRPGSIFLGDDGQARLGCFPPTSNGATMGDDRSAFATVIATALLGTAYDGTDVMDRRLQSVVDPAEAVAILQAAYRKDTSLPTATGLFEAFLTATGLDQPDLLTMPLEENPYPGLRSFDETLGADFHGREAVVGQLCDRLRKPANRLIVITGASGSGKSSLLSAGLLPALRSGAVEGSEQWAVAVMTPGHDPIESLAEALGNVATVADADPGRMLADTVGSTDRGLIEAAEACLGPDRPLLVMVDQLEEIFSADPDGGSTRSDWFLDLLAGGVGDPDSEVRVVATLRADWFDRPLQRQPFAEIFGRSLVTLTNLTPAELERAIVNPARDRGVEMSAALVARLIADVEAEPGALPLLSATLHELWQHRRGSVIECDAYDELGGLTGAVVSRAEALVDELGSDRLDELRRLFGRIVTIAPDRPITRRRVRLTDVLASGVRSSTIDAAVAARLVATDRDPATREPTVTVSHEAVLTRWPRLAGWLSDDRHRLLERGRLTDAAHAWEADDRDPALLLRGTRLERAVELTDDASVLSAVEIDLVEASQADDHRRRVVEERQVRRRRTLTAVIAVVAVIALIAGTVAYDQARRAEAAANVAEVRLLTQAAATTFDTRPALGLQLAVAAVEQGGGVEAERTLVELLQRGPFDRYLGTAENSRCMVALSDPTRARLVDFGVVDDAGLTPVVVWDHDGAPPAPAGSVDLGSSIDCPIVSPAGDRVAVNADGHLTVSTIGSAEAPLSVEVGDEIRGIDWTADGQAIVAIDDVDDGRLHVFDTSDVTALTSLASHELSMSFLAAVATTTIDGLAVVAGDGQAPALVDLRTGDQRPLDDPGVPVGSIEINSDATRIVGRNASDIMAWDGDSGRLLWSTVHSGDADANAALTLNWSGSRVATATSAGIEVFDLVSGDRIEGPLPLAGSQAIIAFSGDDELTVTGPGDRLYSLNLEIDGNTGNRVRVVHRDIEQGGAVAPDGTVSTIIGEGDSVVNVSIDPDGAVTELGRTLAELRPVDTSRIVGYEQRRRHFGIWTDGVRTSDVDLTDRFSEETDRVRTVRVGHGLAVQLVFEPADFDTVHMLVFDDRTAEILLERPVPGIVTAEPIGPDRILLADLDFLAQIIDLEGTPVHQFERFGHPVAAAEQASDGSILIGLADGTIGRHNPETFEPEVTHVGPPSAVQQFIVFPGGFVTYHEDGQVVKWYDGSLEPAGIIHDGGGWWGFGALSDDGSSIYIPEQGRVVEIPLGLDGFVAEACRRAGAVVDGESLAAITGSAPDGALESCSRDPSS